MTLRESARQLIGIAAQARDVAARVDAPRGDRWAIARDLRGIAHNLERNASAAERVGIAAGEPDPDDVAWMSTAAPGEISEVMGR